MLQIISSSAVKKAVFVVMSNTVGTVYTVPSGKVFIGTICGSQYTQTCSIDGKTFTPIFGTDPCFTYSGQLILGPGTVVANTSTSSGLFLIGVEQ